MKLLYALVALACATRVFAQEHRPHQHGLARLEVSAEKNALELRLESPLDNLVGFETSPRTAKEREAIRAVVERFAYPEGLFVPTAAAGCRTSSVKLESAVVEHDLLKVVIGARKEGAEARSKESSGVADHPKDPHAQAKHADFDAFVSFTCAKPEALEGVKVLLFEAFPRLRRIDTRVVTTRGQHAASLTAKRSLLSW
jgi:hypothetical protein